MRTHGPDCSPRFERDQEIGSVSNEVSVAREATGRWPSVWIKKGD